jgi:hypothetical protein
MKRDLVYTTGELPTRPFDATRFLTPSPHQNRCRRPRVEKVGLVLHQALLSGYRCQPMLKCHRAGRYVPLVGQQLLEENALHFGCRARLWVSNIEPDSLRG